MVDIKFQFTLIVCYLLISLYYTMVLYYILLSYDPYLLPPTHLLMKCISPVSSGVWVGGDSSLVDSSQDLPHLLTWDSSRRPLS